LVDIEELKIEGDIITIPDKKLIKWLQDIREKEKKINKELSEVGL